MTEKEKNILNQELWALVALDFHATKHSFEIMQKMLKCVSKEESDEMTPNKRKVIEELCNAALDKRGALHSPGFGRLRRGPGTFLQTVPHTTASCNFL